MDILSFAALAEENRFKIVELLRDKPRPVGEIADRLNIRQPQASKHLRVLADAGIVEVHPQKNLRIYALSPKKFQEIDQWLEKYRSLWEGRLDRIEKVIQEEKKKQSK